MVDLKLEKMSEDQQARHAEALLYPAQMLPDSSTSFNDFRPLPYGASYAAKDQAGPPLQLKTVTSLPSFATLDSGTREDHMTKRLLSSAFREAPPLRQPSAAIKSANAVDHFGNSHCTCSQVKPLITTAGQLVRKLNDTAQRRVLEAEYDECPTPLHTSLQSMQWIVDQLHSIEAHLRNGNEAAIERRVVSTSTSSKRMAASDPFSAFERPFTPSKRARTDSETVSTHRELSPARHHRRSSPSLFRRESVPDIRQPQPQSTDGNINKLLPSPSSSSVHPYAATVQRSNRASSTSPPAASSTSGPTLHSATMTSVASDYIADLQHQVTLKSLALQSLQAEHTNVLQKMHREGVKFQTIEKKSRVADQEINDLLSRNDELLEQTKELTSQVTELERRREEESQAVAREKEQYGRMLDMSGRLQRKAEEDRRHLQEENARLRGQLAWLEKDDKGRYAGDFKQPLAAHEEGASAMLQTEGGAPSSLQRAEPSSSSDRETLRYQITIIEQKAQAEQLRRALEDARQHMLDMSRKAQELHDQRHELTAGIEAVLNGQPSEIGKLRH